MLLVSALLPPPPFTVWDECGVESSPTLRRSGRVYGAGKESATFSSGASSGFENFRCFPANLLKGPSVNHGERVRVWIS